MKSLFLATATAAILAAAPAMAQYSSPGSTAKPGSTAGETSAKHSADTRFIEHAARDNQAEVDLGRLAQQKASSPEVKSFAQRLVTDHGKANQELAQIAQKEGMKMPTGADKQHSNLRAQLDKLNGPAFDRAFMQAQVQDHQKDIDFYQRESNQLQNPQLKSFAQQSLPVLQQHLQLAQQVENQVGTSGSSTPRPPTGSRSR